MKTPGPQTPRSVLPASMLALGLAALLIPACRSAPKAVEYARAYPSTVRQERSLDVQVFRRTKRLELTNTTARAFGPSTLWLNKRFSRPIDALAVGESLDLPLASFRDENSEPFRGGGFFAAEAPETLVLAQLETAGAAGPELLGLVVVNGAPE